jgi:hypothetical protein
MDAIVTKFHGPTNHRNSRVSAKWHGHRVSVEWNHDLDTTENHAAAVRELCKVADLPHRLESMTLAPAGLPNGQGYAWANIGNPFNHITILGRDTQCTK